MVADAAQKAEKMQMSEHMALGPVYCQSLNSPPAKHQGFC